MAHIFRPAALAAAALLLATAAADGQRAGRLDPALVFLLRTGPAAVPSDGAAPDARLPSAVAAPSAGGIAAVIGDPADPFVRAVVRLDSEADGRAALERHGARIGAVAGDVVTARIPMRALPRLADESAIHFIDAASWLSPSIARPSIGYAGRRPIAEAAARNDIGAEEARIAPLRRRRDGDFFGLAGQGVIVGVFDTGLDLEHEDFRGPDGRTRVLYAWDQTSASGRPPGTLGEHVFDYGEECGRTAIDAGECGMRDRNGHGTHVAGIAAGDGSAASADSLAWRFTGAAPAAELIVVKGGDAGYTEDGLIDGVAYIFERARQLGRPAVVNLSLGTQAGPHDGTTPMERALEALAGPGRIIVSSAGNQGTNRNETPGVFRAPLHARGSGSGEHDLIVPEYSPRPGAGNDLAYLELWYDGEDSLSIEVRAPDGTPVTAPTGTTIELATPSGGVFIANAADGPNPENGDHAAIIIVYDAIADLTPRAGDWTIAVEPTAVNGSGDYHLWLALATFDAGGSSARLSRGTTNTHLVSAPATAGAVIAVAAYSSRFDWHGLEDSVSYPVQEPLGDIARFSSPGPRRDGVLKPEITAPGKLIIAARSSDGSLWRDVPFLVERDGRHAALLGTSMANAFVAGTVALLLQLDPTLDADRARGLLGASARHDEFTPHPYTGEPDGSPNAQWGYGKLDAATAAERLRPSRLLAADERVNLSANPVRGDELIINYQSRPAEVGIYTFAGGLVRRLRGGDLGEWLTVWDLTNQAGRRVANGAYLVVVELDDGPAVQKLFVLRP